MRSKIKRLGTHRRKNIFVNSLLRYESSRAQIRMHFQTSGLLLLFYLFSLGAEQLGLFSSGSVRMRRRSTSSTSAVESAQTPCRSLAAPSEAGVKASLHSSTPSMLLALYHYCSPAGECGAIDQQLARFAQPLIRWREREGSGKQEKRGWWGGWGGGGGASGLHKQCRSRLSLCGRNKRAGGVGGGGGRGGRWWWGRGGVT